MAQRTRTRTVIPNRFMRRGPFGGATWPLGFYEGIFSNASPRYLVDGITPNVVGPFAPNVLAKTILPDGMTYGQFEEAKTNLVLRSQEIDSGTWAKTLLTITADDRNDPAGNLTADKCTPDASAGLHRAQQTSIPITTGLNYCVSVWARAGGYSWICVQLQTAFPTTSVYFNLSGAGSIGATAGAPIRPQIKAFNDGWYLCSFIQKSNLTTSAKLDLFVAQADTVLSYTGDGVSHVHMWNPQLELGDFPSSPIATLGSAVTRARDVFAWPAAVVPDDVKKGKFSFNMVPSFAQNELPARSVNWQSKLGATDGWFYDGVVMTFEVWDGAKKAESNIMTFPRYDLLTETLDAVLGTVTLAGAAGGNGTGPTTGAWDWSDWASFPIGDTVQYSGLISEYYP